MTFLKRQETRSNIIMSPINNEFHVQLNNWCDCQKEIDLCEKRKEAEVYRYEWFIGWFKGDRELARLPIFNTTAFKRAWRDFCLQVERARQRFRYAGYYYYRDMEQWLLDVASVREDLQEEADSDSEEDLEDPETVNEAMRAQRRQRARERRQLRRIYADMMQDDVESEVYKKINAKMQNLLPFGFIEWPRRANDCYGQFYIKENVMQNRKKLVFRCRDEVKQRLYKFAVLDFGAKFITASDPESPYCGAVSISSVNELLPITPYWDLFLERDLIAEARLAQGDVNSFRAYPVPIPLAKPLPDAQPTALGEHDLYTLDSLTGARQKPSEEAQRMAVQRAAASIEGIKRALGGGRRTQQQKTLIDKRKTCFNRPYLEDNIGQPLGDNVTLSNVQQPDIILQPEEMMRQYENTICTLMNLPFIFYKPHVDGSAYAQSGSSSSGQQRSGGQGLNDGTQQLYQRLLEDEVVKQQSLFDGVFKEIYYNTVYHLYDRLFAATGRRLVGDQIEPRLQFERRIVKNDVAISSLLPFYEAGIIDASHIRAFLFPSFGIDERPDIDEDVVIRKRSARGYGEAESQASKRQKQKK